MVVKKKVTWRVDRTFNKEPRTRQYIPETPLTEEHQEVLKDKLLVGNLFRTNRVLEIDNGHYAKISSFPYLYEGWYSDRGYPINTLAVYAGLVRVEELKGTSTIRVPRHSFIILGKRYLVINLNLFFPVD